MRARRAVDLVALLSALSFGTCPSFASQGTMDAQSACKLLSPAERKHRVGETIRFRGRYGTDHIEREVVWAINCQWGIGVRDMAFSVTARLDRLDGVQRSPLRVIEAVYVGKFVRVQPNGFQYSNDDGVRLDLFEIGNPVVAGTPPNWERPGFGVLH